MSFHDEISKLIGKTIRTAEIKKIHEEWDDEPYLDIEFTDGTRVRISANYRYSLLRSEDEYARFIAVEFLEAKILNTRRRPRDEAG